jgi:hypothetical protein
MQTITLDRYKPWPDDKPALFTYLGDMINDHMDPFLLCANITHLIPKSMAGLIFKLDYNRRYAFDLAYDLDTMQYIERNKAENYVGHTILALIVDRNLYMRMINYYDEADKIRPILNKIDDDTFTLTIAESDKLIDQNCEIDISSKWKCNCYEFLHSNKCVFTPEFVKQMGDLSKAVKFRNRIDVFHPIYLPNQSHHTTMVFHKKFPDLTIKANNILICRDYPILYFSS